MGDVILEVKRNDIYITIRSTWGESNYNDIIAFGFDIIKRFGRDELDYILQHDNILNADEIEYLRLKLL